MIKRQRVHNRVVQPRKEPAETSTFAAQPSPEGGFDQYQDCDTSPDFHPAEHLNLEEAVFESLHDQLQGFLEQSQSNSRVGARVNLSQYQEKSKANHEAWEGLRPSLQQHYVQGQAIPEQGTLCSLCHLKPFAVKCLDCQLEGWLLCGSCDAVLHPYAHFHRRRVFTNGFCEPISPDVSFSAEGLLTRQGMHPGLCTFAILGLLKTLAQLIIFFALVFCTSLAGKCFKLRPKECSNAARKKMNSFDAFEATVLESAPIIYVNQGCY